MRRMGTTEISDDDVVRYAASLGQNPAALFPRNSVQEIECSRCRALPGLPCRSTRGRVRTANHLERCFDRIRLYLATQDGMRKSSH